MASIDKQGSARRNAQPPSRHAAGHTLPTHNLAFGRLAVGFAGFAALVVQPAPLCIAPALSQHNHLSNTQHSFSCAAGDNHAHRGEFDLCACRGCVCGALQIPSAGAKPSPDEQLPAGRATLITGCQAHETSADACPGGTWGLYELGHRVLQEHVEQLACILSSCVAG
mgnify:CR=1 FL=1